LTSRPHGCFWPLSYGCAGWHAVAWSGDIFQANLNGYAHLKPVMPKEGGLFWTDSMCIPYIAGNPLDAMTYMDYAYRPGKYLEQHLRPDLRVISRRCVSASADAACR
jgi:hypothetical protein